MILSRSGLCLIAAALLTATTAQADGDHAPIGEAIKDVPLFDAHIHYKEPAWGPYPVKSVIELMDRNGVAMGLVSSTPDEGTIMLWEYAPNRIVPELRPYHGSAGSGNWTKAPGMEEYLEERLAKYPHEGLGEFHIHNLDPTDRPLLQKVTAMAKARSIPIHVHSGADPVHLLYELEPALTIIWAHAGMSEPADVVEKVMETYPTLYADTSFRENDILKSMTEIDPHWHRILTRFADRLMVGTDTWINAQWDNYSELIALNRQWLSLLPRKTAEQIAYKTAEKLFNRKVSMDQIGTK